MNTKVPANALHAVSGVCGRGNLYMIDQSRARGALAGRPARAVPRRSQDPGQLVEPRHAALVWQQLGGRATTAAPQQQQQHAHTHNTMSGSIAHLERQEFEGDDAAARLRQWHALTRSRRWGGRVHRLANLLDPMGVADYRALKEAFLQQAQPSLAARSPIVTDQELGSIAKQLGDDERNCCEPVLELAKRRLLAALVEMVPAGAPNADTISYRERRRQRDRALAIAMHQDLSPAVPRLHTLVRCSLAAIGTIIGQAGANIKRIGAQLGCKIFFCPTNRCFVLESGSSEVARRAQDALRSLETNFTLGQQRWAAEKARRRARENLVPRQISNDPAVSDWKEEAGDLWRRHRRGRKKAESRHRQRVKIGNPSKDNKRPARGANSRVYAQMREEAREHEEKACVDVNMDIDTEMDMFYAQIRRLHRTRKQQHNQCRERQNQIAAAKKAALEFRAVLQPAIHGLPWMDAATQRQWELLAKSRRWGGLVQQLINLLRPRFAGDAPFVVKSAFALSNATQALHQYDAMLSAQQGAVACADRKIDAVLLQLRVPAEPKRGELPAAMAAQQASRSRLVRAVELLQGANALTQLKDLATTGSCYVESFWPKPAAKLSPAQPKMRRDLSRLADLRLTEAEEGTFKLAIVVQNSSKAAQANVGKRNTAPAERQEGKDENKVSCCSSAKLAPAAA